MAQDYPYSLPTHAWYNLRTLQVDSEVGVDFFYKCKRSNENIYIGPVHKSNILFDTSTFARDHAISYLTKRSFNGSASFGSHLSIKLLPKLCWLTETFFTTGFKFPVCVHYNPRIEQNVMHPGSTRNYIIDLFQTSPFVECLYFNTGGVQFPFMDSMRVFERDELYNYPTRQVSFVADHCSIIPHINLDVSSVEDSIPIWHEKLKARLTDPNFRIFMNKDIHALAEWQTADIDAKVRIFISDLKNHKDILRAIILSIMNIPYESETLTVAIK
jgi:hypothetical protein